MMANLARTCRVRIWMNRLIKRASHCNMACQIRSQTPIEVRGPSLQVRGESAIAHRQIVVFFLIHFLVDNILFRNAERPACSPFVYL